MSTAIASPVCRRVRIGSVSFLNAKPLIYGLEDLGFCDKGEAAGFIGARNTAPGGKLPLATVNVGAGAWLRLLPAL